MNIRDIRGLKASAREAIRGASYDPRMLIFMHTAATVVLSLVLSLVDHVLQDQIGGTGGLSGVGNRAILETVQTVLTVAQAAVVLFWQIGYIYVALRISRGKAAEPQNLLQGFRKFGPVLRFRLSLGFLYTGMILACIYGSSIIFSLTPWAEPLMAAYETGSEEALLLAVEECMVPLMGIAGVLMLVIVVPYIYRLRMAEYALMDHPEEGAMVAIRKSRWMMRGNRMALLKVDLSFWWFYALEVLVMAIAYGDLLLESFGVVLPWSSTVSYYVFLVLCYAGQLALYWWKGNDLQITYAKCYDALLPKKEPETAQ